MYDGVVQLDAAGLLFLLLITGTSIATSPSQSAEAVQRLWLACLLHALPLAAMMVNLPWCAPPLNYNSTPSMHALLSTFCSTRFTMLNAPDICVRPFV
jgi:hypothetical protein